MSLIEGYVEAIRPFQVRGWAYDTNAPEDIVDVTLMVGEEVVATGRADVFRPDLVSARWGDGHHGFILNLERKLTRNEQNEVVLMAASRRCGLPQALISLPDSVLIEPAQSSAVPHELASSITGFVTRSSPVEIVGWALDSDRPNDHLAVDVLAGDRLLGSAVADQFRADLLVAMIGNGDHGFRVQIDPAFPLDNLRTVTVRARSTEGSAGSRELLEANVLAQEAPAPEHRVQRGVRFPTWDMDRSQHPVFVLGAARSGTSAMAQALVRTTRYEGHEEGHLLDLIGPLFRTIERHYVERSEEWQDQRSTLIASVPKGFFESGVRHIFVELARALFPAGWWVDKTPRPEMIAVAPMLKAIWPEAQFIFMKRRGIENIASRMRKFPAVAFEQHCRDWCLGMQGWKAVRGLLAGNAIEVDQSYLATHPEKVAMVLGSALLLKSDEVIDLTQALMLDRPERTSERFAGVESLSAIDWTAEQKVAFREICGPTMSDFGYGMEQDYFLGEAQDYGMMRR